MKNAFIPAMISILFSCTNYNSKSSEQGPSNAPSREIDKANWLIGEWSNTTDKGSVVEMWEKLNDSVFVGKSFFIRGVDTVSAESIKLIQQGNELSYVPTVKNQNDGQPVTFKLTSSTSNK